MLCVCWSSIYKPAAAAALGVWERGTKGGREKGEEGGEAGTEREGREGGRRGKAAAADKGSQRSPSRARIHTHHTHTPPTLARTGARSGRLTPRQRCPQPCRCQPGAAVPPPAAAARPGPAPQPPHSRPLRPACPRPGTGGGGQLGHAPRPPLPPPRASASPGVRYRGGGFSAGSPSAGPSPHTIAPQRGKAGGRAAPTPPLRPGTEGACGAASVPGEGGSPRGARKGGGC